ncbi:MAG: hypothetical protein ACK53L_22890, partial [Pirellulaceae bacterium]
WGSAGATVSGEPSLLRQLNSRVYCFLAKGGRARLDTQVIRSLPAASLHCLDPSLARDRVSPRFPERKTTRWRLSQPYWCCFAW